MKKAISIIVFSVLVMNEAFMRPVFKILLTQNEYAQFLQYDLQLPNMKEFTFCVWIKPFSLELDQTIFAYNVDGNRLLRLWLEAGGMMLKLAISGNIIFNYPVKIKEKSWNHLCLTYQSSYGLWAVYFDEEFLACGASEDTVDFTLPGGGTIIVGHGIDEKGIPNGFEGEIYGVNMIIKTLSKILFKNKLRYDVDKEKYIVLKDIRNTPNFKNNHTVETKTKKFEKFSDKYLSDSEIYDFSNTFSTKVASKENNKLHFWSQNHKAGQEGNYKTDVAELKITESGTNVQPTISIFETPPPLEQPDFKYDIEIDVPSDTLSTTMTPPVNPLYSSNFKNAMSDTSSSKKAFPEEKKRSSPSLVDFETPPRMQDNTEVYGQWFSSDFARRVLGYLKHTNLPKRQPSVPPTIPLTRISDSLPYASELRNTVQERLAPLHPKRNFKLVKREANKHKIINLQLLLDGNDIIKHQLAETRPVHVEITNRGYTDNSQQTEKWHRNIRDSSISKHTSAVPPRIEPINHLFNNSIENKNYQSVIPFLKSLEYFVEKSTTENFHNIKPYNTYYIPREINMELIDNDKSLTNIANQNRISIKSKQLFPHKLESSKTISKIPQQKPALDFKEFRNIDAINIGSPLNEWYVMGLDLEGKRKHEQKKHHRDSDNFDYIEKIPPSLLSIACANTKNFENNNQLLPYIQQDINYVGTEFIAINFNKCLEEKDFPSIFDNLLLINWEITPVRLFGGATPVKTVLCV